MADPRGRQQPTKASDAGPSRSRGRVLLWIAVLGYLLAVVALWVWMLLDGDRGWMATLVLFGPRWIAALPLPVLAIWAGIRERRLLAPLLLAGAIIVFGLLNFEVHLPRSGDGGSVLRIITCNAEGRAIRPDLLAQLIERHRPDVVALQEFAHGTPLEWPVDWHVVERDEFIVGSRYSLRTQGQVARPGHPFMFAAVHFALEHPDREIHLFNVHLESPRAGLEAVLSRRVGIDFSRTGELTAIIQRRALESQVTRQWIAGFTGPKLVVGDFNLPPDSTIFRQDWSSFADAFGSVGFGFGFTKTSEKDGWSYGARIDHALADDAWRVLRCWVAEPVGSDHLPLVTEFELQTGR